MTDPNTSKLDDLDALVDNTFTTTVDLDTGTITLPDVLDRSDDTPTQGYTTIDVTAS